MSIEVISGINAEVNDILAWFRELSRIPRCSGNEGKVGEWLLKWSKDHHFEARKDDVGNVVIRIPATPGYENHAVVVLQGHQDMVCEKSSGFAFDFTQDGIEVMSSGEWIHADHTTLGADNGIAIAMSLALALDKSAAHPPLELLFTVDEERGLTGAFAIAPDFLRGRLLLNLDSEWDGVFTIGCAGGQRSNHYLNCVYEIPAPDHMAATLRATGMTGGHSADIHQEKANALKVLARALDGLFRDIPFRLASITGGSADNAIPREAEAVLWLPEKEKERFLGRIHELEMVFRGEFRNTDPELALVLREGYDGEKHPYRGVFSDDLTERLIGLLIAAPHGIWAMSAEVEHFVETSNNLASINVEDDKIKIITSQRSPVDSRLDAVTRQIEMAVRLAGGVSSHRGRYPGWNANKKSPILARCVEIWKRIYNQEPVVETTHGGLECGVIGSKFEGMDMISFGPVIQNPHCPEERLNVVSLGKVHHFLKVLLAEL